MLKNRENMRDDEFELASALLSRPSTMKTAKAFHLRLSKEPVERNRTRAWDGIGLTLAEESLIDRELRAAPQHGGAVTQWRGRTLRSLAQCPIGGRDE